MFLYMFHFWPAQDTVTNTEWQLPEVVLIQFASPDDEHDVPESFRDLNIKNRYMIKNCASRWSFTKNHNTMQGQQNVKEYAISLKVWSPPICLACAKWFYLTVLCWYMVFCNDCDILNCFDQELLTHMNHRPFVCYCLSSRHCV
jgi:hypothetical protein